MTMSEDSAKQAEQREQWIGLLNAAWMFHQQLVKETSSEIIGAEESEDTLFHKAISVAIMDAMNMIQQVEALGWFDDDGDMEHEVLSTPGPAG